MQMMNPKQRSARCDEAEEPQANPRIDPIQILLEASTSLLGPYSVNAVLPRILDLAKRVIAADAYAVWRGYDEGRTWRMLMARGLSDSYRAKLIQSTGVLLSEPVLIPDVDAHALVEEQREIYRQEGIRSLLVVPLMIEGQGSGAITFYYRRRHEFSSMDVSYASALGNFSAAALHTSELYENNQREKRRLSFLAEASAVLASSLDYEATLERVAQLAVPYVADWCIVYIVEHGVPTRLTAAHADPHMLALAKQVAERYPEKIREDRGIGKVLRTGLPELYPEIPDHFLVEAAHNEEHLRLLRALGLHSALAVPLETNGRVLGVIRLFASRPGHSLNEDDLRLAQDLARRAAVAVENARLHRELQESETRLRLSHAAAGMGSWSWDLVRQKITWSEEFKRLHGLPPDATSGYEGGAQLIHPDDRPRVLKELQEVLASRAEELTFEHRAITGDGRVVWIYSRGRIERAPDGTATGIRGICMDVTERRNTEEALRRTEKLATAGRLAATVAHEINNPLEAVTNLVYLARTAETVDPEIEAHLLIAEQELKRIEHIAKQTLGFYRESVAPRRVDLRSIISEMLELYRRRMQAKLLRVTESMEADVVAEVIAGEIKQVMANLISNAIDATPENGAIRIGLVRSGDMAEISVTDSGAGVPEQHRNRLFEPFFTTKEDVGTGLGLWVTKGIVEHHGGTISFRSSTDPGHTGTTFAARIPLDRRASEAVIRGTA